MRQKDRVCVCMKNIKKKNTHTLRPHGCRSYYNNLTYLCRVSECNDDDDVAKPIKKPKV